jgi:hypothetical protein
MFPTAGPLAGWAGSGKDGLVSDDLKAGLLRGNLAREEDFRHINIDEDAADRAADVVVTIGAFVEAARLISEWKLENQTAFGKEMQGPVDGPIGDRWVTSVDALEDFTGGQVAVGTFDGFEDGGPLWGHPEVGLHVMRCGAHR